MSVKVGLNATRTNPLRPPLFFFSNKIKRNIPSETTVITSTITFFQKNRPGINIKIGHPQPNARSSEISQRELSEQRRNEDEEEKKIAIT